MSILVSGAGGCLGGHLVQRLAKEHGATNVTATDIKTQADWWQRPPRGVVIEPERDLTDEHDAAYVVLAGAYDLVFHLAADMGGLGFLGDKTNDGVALIDNTSIDLNVFTAAKEGGVKRLVYASSACVYPQSRQATLDAAPLREEDAYPADPDLEYGWEKLFAERVLASLKSAAFRPLAVRFHNVYGSHGSWTGGREKAPAAMCRKVAEAKLSGGRYIPVWGDGKAMRSYLFVEDWIDGILRLAATDETDPINLGSDRAVSVDELAAIVSGVAGWPIEIHHEAGPQGVRARNSDNSRLRKVLGWEPPTSLEDGLAQVYPWIEEQVRKAGA